VNEDKKGKKLLFHFFHFFAILAMKIWEQKKLMLLKGGS